ncbi:hypothetical protein BC831DRAFT_471866, partial [Entophlyctis helioformis]
MRLVLLMRLVRLGGSECHVQCAGHLVVGGYCDAAIPLLGYLAEPGGSCGLVVLGGGSCGLMRSWAVKSVAGRGIEQRD